MQTYTNSGLGIFAAPLAAAMAGIGAAQVNLISQQKFTPRERGGPMTGGKPYLVGERGPELIIPGQGGTVMNNRDLMSTMGEGGGETNIVFDVKTNDAKGFQEMVLANRGLFINMIKQAQNEKLGAGI
jgi:phage-related minor tail protein